MNITENQWLSVKGVANYLGISTAAVYARVARRELPFSKLQKTLLFEKRQIDSLLKKNSTPSLMSSK